MNEWHALLSLIIAKYQNMYKVHIEQALTKPYSLYDLRSVGISNKSEFNIAKIDQFTVFGTYQMVAILNMNNIQQIMCDISQAYTTVMIK